MRWYTDYMEECRHVFAEAEALIRRFPEPLGQIGADYLKRFNPFLENSSNNYICYLLPYWINRDGKVSPEVCRKLSLADVLIMLHFFVLDDVMDEGSPAAAHMLPFATLCSVEWLCIYRELFPSSSTFWNYYRQYMTEWAESVSNEADRNPFLSEPLTVARKAAPVKLAAAGLLLLAKQESLIPLAEAETEQALLALQMVDDWADWREDLRSGSYNGLLVTVLSQRGLPAEQELTEDEVLHALYITGCLRRYLEIGCGTDGPDEDRNRPFPELAAFRLSALRELAEEAERIDKEARTLELGGFYHWFSKNCKN